MNIFSFLSGYKTYIVGVCMVVVGWYNGDTALIMQGLGLLSLRAAISKVS